MDVLRTVRVRLAIADLDLAGLDVERAISSFAIVGWSPLPDAEVVLVCIPESQSSVERVLERIRRIRGAGFARGLCVVAPFLADRHAAEVLDAGADVCVVGSAYRDVLPACLRALTRRLISHRAGDERIAFELHPNSRQVTIEGETIMLRRRGFEILAHLASQEGRWVRARELMLSVFGRGDAGDTTLLRVHIRELRRAIGEHASVLASERGLGYRLSLAETGGLGGRGRDA